MKPQNFHKDAISSSYFRLNFIKYWNLLNSRKKLNGNHISNYFILFINNKTINYNTYSCSRFLTKIGVFLDPDRSLFLEFELLEFRLFVGLVFLLLPFWVVFVRLLDLGSGLDLFVSFVVFRFRDLSVPLELKLFIEFGTLVARVTILVILTTHIYI